MRTQEIADFLSAELVGDGSVEIERVADLSTAGKGEIAFLEKAESVPVTSASCVIVQPDFSGDLPCPIIKAKNPKLAFARIAATLIPWPDRNEWHETAVVAAQDPNNHSVRADFVGVHVSIGDGTYIG
ncbi:MAG: LpxD N-terminal domain-containing protein, partial [Acidobacteriota bacterium]